MNRIVAAALLALALVAGPPTAEGQRPSEGEVRQLVTFRFLPGRADEVLAAYREQAIPLYRRDDAMLSFRGLREVESPVPLDLVVVSAFRGMAGMDASNAALRALAEESGSSIGEIYGAIGALSSSHHDHFIEMLPALGSGDPTAERLVALVWYRLEPGRADLFESIVATDVTTWEASLGVAAATGRFLVSDGWHYLRFIGLPSLAAYQSYWTRLRTSPAHDRLAAITLERREAILAPVPEMSVR